MMSFYVFLFFAITGEKENSRDLQSSRHMKNCTAEYENFEPVGSLLNQKRERIIVYTRWSWHSNPTPSFYRLTNLPWGWNLSFLLFFFYFYLCDTLEVSSLFTSSCIISLFIRKLPTLEPSFLMLITLYMTHICNNMVLNYYFPNFSIISWAQPFQFPMN